MKHTQKEFGSSIAERIVVSFLEYAFAFTVIIECNSLFHYSENYRQTTFEIVVTMLAIVLAGILTTANCMRFKARTCADLRKCWPVLVTLLVLILAFLALNVMRIGAEHSMRKYLLSFVFFFPTTYLLLRTYRAAGDPENLLFKYADITMVITICNMVVFTAVTFRPEIIQAQLLKSRWSGHGYIRNITNYLDLCCVTPSDKRTITDFTFYRNMAFFTEPLMFCIPLITTLFTEMYLRPKENRRVWKWIILLAAVITTQSTLGMLLASGAVGIKIIECVKPKRRWIMLFPALILVSIFAFLLLQQKSNVGGNSTAAHIEHYIAAFKTFLEHPLIGCGYLREESILCHISEKFLSISKGLSNSIAVVFAEGGIFLGFLCMVPFFIGLAQIKSKNNKRISLWMLGPLGLYCVTVFHFHLILMIFMAYGYSMLELTQADANHKRKLVLADENESPKASDCPLMGERIAKATALLLGCCAAATLVLSKSLWRALFSWMLFHQIYLGQSAWKVFFFFIFLILTVLVIRFAIHSCFSGKENELWIAVTVWFVLYTVLYATLYPAIYSMASTMLEIMTPFGDFFETAALAGLYFGGIIVGWLLIDLFQRKKLWFGLVLAAVIVFAGGITTGVWIYTSKINTCTDEIVPVIEKAVIASNGKVYANERQMAIKHTLPKLSYAPARDGAFAALKNASVVTIHDKNLGELFDAGFEVTELSSEYILYSNDESVIEELKSSGYEFFEYYPFAMSIENEAAIILKSGNYTLTAELKKSHENVAYHEPIGCILITAFYGTETVNELVFYADEFDENGDLMVEIPFDAGDWEGMEYQIIPEEGADVLVKEITLTSTPKYLTYRTLDSRCSVIHEAYYDLSGAPFYQSQGYAAFTNEYDRAGRLIRRAYYDGNDMPVRIKEGYSSYTREYNRQGRLSKETFFDENGNLCLLRQGYVALEREYDKKGNATIFRYLGADGLPVMITNGYAEERRVYNEKKQLVEQMYFDDVGEKVQLPDGYWLEKRGYDEAGNVIIQQYFDTEGLLVITSMGYAEIHKTYDNNKRVIYIEYFGTKSEPISVSNGIAAVYIDYGKDGKETARHYYSLDGAEFIPDA